MLGVDLTETELRCLARFEWGQGAADVQWRRIKLGLHMTPQGIAQVDAVLEVLQSQQGQAA